MRPRLALLLPILGLQVLAAQAPDPDPLLERIDRLHARVYGAGNLLATPYGTDPDDVEDWRRMMADVARLASAPGQQELTEVLKIFQAASEDLVTQRRRAWYAVRPCLAAGPGAGGTRLDHARLDLRDVVRGDLQLRERARAVDRAYGWTKGLLQGPMGAEPRTRAALEVLRRLGYLLRITLARYGQDLQELAREARLSPSSS